MKNILKMSLVIGSIFLGWSLSAQTTETPTTAEPAKADDIHVIAVYPNPATERLLIEFTAEEWDERLLLRVMNEDGKTILKRHLLAAPGGNMVILQVGEFPLGDYVVQLDEGRRAKAVKWQKM